MFWILVELANSRFTVISPKKSTPIQYFLGNIGLTPYGTTIQGTVVQAQQLDLCDVNQTTSFQNKFVLAERGNCTFTTKLLTAQKFGARLLIISDNIIEKKGVIMRDDGKGRYASIPCIFISNKSGQQLRDLIKYNKQVIASVQFEQKKKNISQVDIILTSADRHSYKILRDLKPIIKKLQNQIILSVHYYSFKCEFCEQQNCLYNKQVCLVDFSNLNQKNGQKLIEQQIRQIFLLNKNYSYLQYMDQYDKHCNTDFKQQCAKLIMDGLQINSTQIQQQVLNQINVNSSQSILIQHRKYISNSGVRQVPWILVNGQIYQGILSAHGVALMICGSLQTFPQQCKQYYNQKNATNGQIALFVVVIILLIAWKATVLYFCIKCCSRSNLPQQMRKGVSLIVGKVVALGKRQPNPNVQVELIQQIHSQRL